MKKNKKLRIALVYDMIYPYSIGGAEYRNFSLAKQLVLKGHEVHIFGIKMWSGKKTQKVTDNFFINGVSTSGKKYNFKGQRNIFDPLKYSFFLFFELMKYDFDIIDCSAFPYFPAFSCKLYSMLKRKKLVITWHEVWQDYWPEYHRKIAFIGKFVERLVAKISKNSIAVSKLTKKRLENLGQKNIKVIENWIDFKEIDKAKVLRQKYDVISVGRHLQHKNFDLLLRISSVMKFKLLIIGEGPETPHLLKIKKELNLKNVDILSFTKEKDQLYRYLKSSKLFVLLSELEGFSIISFEAMAAGLPVITIDAKRNALKDYIEDGQNGYVCKKNQIDIMNNIKNILENKKTLDKMNRYAVEIAKKFDINKKIKEILSYYHEINNNNS